LREAAAVHTQALPVRAPVPRPQARALAPEPARELAHVPQLLEPELRRVLERLLP
jgi:hypothetical protein